MPSGKVKFFNREKGFGYVVPDDGGADIFIHAADVDQAGISGLKEKDEIDFDVERDPRTGRYQATQLELTAIALSRPHQGARTGNARSGPTGPAAATAILGIVKWYDPDKGFGFITRSDGAEDAFVHVSAVQQAGLPPLEPGQRLVFDLVVDPRKNKTTAGNLRPDV